MRTPTFSQRTLAGIFLVGLLAITLWSALSGTAPGDVSLLPCPVKWAAGVDCPGCGMTRASVAFTRGDFQAAWDFHPFAFLLIPLAAVYWLSPTGTRALWTRTPGFARTLVVLALLIASCGRWVAQAPWA